MAELGYALSSEELKPRDLVANAVRAEETGFGFSLISDHFHPWTDEQGESAFVWSVIGAIAASTERLRLGTGVTCPTIRTHPAIIAQAAATSGCLMPGRFFLGVGSGEALNEHITGAPWPSTEVRQEMMAEAVEVIGNLWLGGLVSHRGRHFTVENARIYSLPDPLPPIYVAASGTNAAELAGKIGDGLIGTGPDREIVDTFQQQGNSGPRIAQVTVCYAKTVDEAKETAYKIWPNAALKGAFKMELPLPKHFEEAVSTITADQVAEKVVCGPDPKAHLAQIEEYVNAGFDMIYVHQVGREQEPFFRFYKEEILPAFSEKFAGRKASAA
ncbi:MAG: TIGR03557 family F420-dependent LLM class oxidoreductase [Dehalococcoidia bacterium]